MGKLELYSERQRRLSGQVPRPDKHDELPAKFRVQFTQIMRETLGECGPNEDEFDKLDSRSGKWFAIWVEMEKTIKRELGYSAIGNSTYGSDDRIIEHFLSCDNGEAIDIMEIVCKYLLVAFPEIIRQTYSEHSEEYEQIPRKAAAAHKEVNIRLRDSLVALRFDLKLKTLVRVDSETLDTEILQLASDMLADSGFREASEDFAKALGHHRAGNTKEAIQNACVALETTCKTILQDNEWDMPVNPTLRPLIDSLFDNGLIDSSLKDHFEALKKIATSGVGTIGNRKGRHGRQRGEKIAPRYFSGYVVHSVGSAIIFLLDTNYHMNDAA